MAKGEAAHRFMLSSNDNKIDGHRAHGFKGHETWVWLGWRYLDTKMSKYCRTTVRIRTVMVRCFATAQRLRIRLRRLSCLTCVPVVSLTARLTDTPGTFLLARLDIHLNLCPNPNSSRDAASTPNCRLGSHSFFAHSISPPSLGPMVRRPPTLP